MESVEPQTRLRPRISLLSLLLLTGVVACGIVIAQQARELSLLRHEVERLRTETGQLTISDPSRAYTMRIPTDDDRAHRYRVFLPEGSRYFFCYEAINIPEAGVVANSLNRTPVDPGEYVLTVSLEQMRDEKTGERLQYLDASFKFSPVEPSKVGDSFSVSLGEMQNEWINEAGFTILTQTPGFAPQQHDPNSPLVLYRGRPSEKVVTRRDAEGNPVSWTNQSLKGVTDGLLIWIEPR